MQSGSASATTLNTASYTFTPVADSYVAADAITTNYGTSAVLKADASPDYHSYLRFNVNDIHSTVTQATLLLYTTSTSTIGYQVGSVTDNTWDEAKLTYANAPALGLVESSSGSFSSGTWVSVDVTSLITGNGVYDLGIRTTSPSLMSFNSRDASTNAPQLVIQTLFNAPPTPTNTNTPTATATNTPTPTATATLPATQAAVNVFVNATKQGAYSLSSGQSQSTSFPGVNNGPVKVTSNMNIVAAERIIDIVNGIPTSFTEMMGLPNSQLDTTYWLPWYNNVDLDTQLRLGNVSSSTATVHAFIGGTEVTPVSGITLLTGASTRVSYAGMNSGPVKIVSNQNIVAAERVIYQVNGTNTSFSEMMGLPNSQLDTTYWLPWYNNVDLDTQLRFGNVSSSTATVHVFIGGTEVTPGSGITLLTGASTRVSYAGVNSGPVKIVSNQNIVAAERVIYTVNGINTSFTEVMGLPKAQLDTTYWMPWYNNVDLDTQLRFGNVSSSTATVHVYIGGSEMISSPFTLLAGQSMRVNFVGVNNGPVQVVSNKLIVAAERIIDTVNGIPTSFTEMIGLPNAQLDTIYWLPWYNNVDLDTQLRFAVP